MSIPLSDVSYLRHTHRSVTNPTKNALSGVSKPLSSLTNSPDLCSPKHRTSSKFPKKTVSLALLGVNSAVTGPSLPGICSTEHRGRSISLFTPESSSVYDAAYNIETLDSYPTFVQALTTYPSPVSKPPIKKMSPTLSVSTSLPFSPVFAMADTNGPPYASTPMTDERLDDAFSSPVHYLEGSRHSLPHICPLSKSDTRSSSSLASSAISPSARARRTASLSSTPLMHMETSASNYTLAVKLPTEIQPEMVTISAKKGDKLAVVADAWHMEENCHYEWQIRFAPHDIDMNSIKAVFGDEGDLTIDIKRRGHCYATLGGWGTRMF